MYKSIPIRLFFQHYFPIEALNLMNIHLTLKKSSCLAASLMPIKHPIDDIEKLVWMTLLPLVSVQIMH